MTNLSVYDKAVQLQNRARQIAAGAVGEKEAARVLSRSKELRSALTELRAQVELSHQLAGLGATHKPDLSGIDTARTAFERKALNGLPSDTVFNTARKKVQELSGNLKDESGAAWITWSTAQVAELPLARIPMLSRDEREAARNREKELRQAVATKNLSKSDVTLFTSTYALLADSLHDKSDPPSELLELLRLLEKRPSPTLRDITDSDIALLRQFEMDIHITLQRTGA
ncbi:hypothetical protein OG453_07520 [Streptomyces sp. NBC_01381]|uniref:hypothetical protein n=1 Tax=Streptomyces sp. NBC_01381 TaxID=2903845 RepID=UPI00225A9551|nr:hypothetical protein [Streptomyces sp. NBC_01381]MCX4666518.1 hypothetical protein [Streptomyces sp. NBC_01381]